MIPIHEDFGMSAIEAISGKIVLASKEGGLVEIFGHDYQFYININDINDSFNNLLNKIYYLSNKQNPISIINFFTFKSFIINFERSINNLNTVYS